MHVKSDSTVTSRQRNGAIIQSPVGQKRGKMRACDAAPGCPARQALRVVQGCLFLRQIAREGVKAMKSVLYLVILKSFNSAVRDHGRIFSLPLLPLFVLAAAGVQPALANGVNATIGNGQVVTGTVTGSGVDS